MANIWRRQPGSGRIDHTSLVRTETTDPVYLIANAFWEVEYDAVLKVWNGSAWVPQEQKVWTGSAWQCKPMKVWSGTAWLTVNNTGSV